MNRGKGHPERVYFMLTALVFGILAFIGFIGIWIESVIWYENIRRDWPWSENKLAIRLYRLVTTSLAIGASLLILLFIIGFLRCYRMKFAMAMLMFIFMLGYIAMIVTHAITVAWTRGNKCDEIKALGLDKGKTRKEYIEWSHLFGRTEESIWKNQCPRAKTVSLAFFCIELVGIFLLFVVTYPLALKSIDNMLL